MQKYNQILGKNLMSIVESNQMNYLPRNLSYDMFCPILGMPLNVE